MDVGEIVTCGSFTGTRCRMSVALVVHGEGVWRTEDGNSIAWSSGPPSTGYCIRCGARVFFDAAGKPVAQAMVPAEALDYFVGHLGGGEHPFCPLDWHEGESTPWCEATGDGVWEDVTCNKDPRECWRAAALAAAEEGAESDGRQAE